MIIDSSAIMAILLSEPEGGDCLRALLRATSRRMSAATLLEASIVADRRSHPDFPLNFGVFMQTHDIVIEHVTEAQARIARLAYRQYGKGNDSKAKLNFGDCFAYALARERNEPLLFTGDDFIHTDIQPAIAP